MSTPISINLTETCTFTLHPQTSTLLTGDVATGKSVLTRKFLHELLKQSDYDVVIFSPCASGVLLHPRIKVLYTAEEFVRFLQPFTSTTVPDGPQILLVLEEFNHAVSNVPSPALRDYMQQLLGYLILTMSTTRLTMWFVDFGLRDFVRYYPEAAEPVVHYSLTGRGVLRFPDGTTHIIPYEDTDIAKYVMF